MPGGHRSTQAVGEDRREPFPSGAFLLVVRAVSTGLCGRLRGAERPGDRCCSGSPLRGVPGDEACRRAPLKRWFEQRPRRRPSACGPREQRLAGAQEVQLTRLELEGGPGAAARDLGERRGWKRYLFRVVRKLPWLLACVWFPEEGTVQPRPGELEAERGRYLAVSSLPVK